MRRIIFIGLMILPTISSAQYGWRDSLFNLINTDKLTLAKKIGAYHMITESYAAHDLKNTYIYGMKGLELAQEANDKIMITIFYRYIGSTYAYRTSYDTAYMYQQMQVNIAEDIQHKYLLQLSYFGMGNLYARQGKFLQAVDSYQKSITFYDEEAHGAIDFHIALANLEKSYYINHTPLRIYLLALGNMGECYRRLNNTARAKYYLEQAMNIAENRIDGEGSLHQIYRELGYVYFAQGEIDKALEYYLKVMNLLSTPSPVAESDTKEAMIKVYIIKGEFDKALELANDCLRLAESLGDPYIDVLAWNSFAEIYRAQGCYEKCESAAMKAWSIDSTSIDTAPISALNIAYANLFLGNKKKAEFFFKKNENFQEQKSNKNFQEAMADMEVKYETEKKEMQIASLEKEKQLYTWLGIASLLFAFTIVVVLWQQIKNARKEKQLIATRSVMDGEMRERTRLARDLHDRLSGNLAAVKIEISNSTKFSQNANSKLDACIEEVRRVAHNLMPISLQFGLKVALADFVAQFPGIQFHFFGEERRIEESKEFVIYCCASELVNNSIRHSGANSINMQLIQDKRHVTLTVQDDGCGFNEKSVGRGFGLKNIRDRVTSCNGKIDTSSSPGKGAETTIELTL